MSKRQRPWWLALLTLFALLLTFGSVAADRIQLDLGRLDHPLFSLEGLRVTVGSEGHASHVSVGRLSVDGNIFEDISLACVQLHLVQGQLDCRGGEISIPALGAPLHTELRLNPSLGNASVELQRADLGVVRIKLASSGHISVDFSDLSVAAVMTMLPQVVMDWGGSGHFNGRLTYVPDGAVRQFELVGKLTDGAFASIDGLHAAENIDLDLDVSARDDGESHGWRWNVDSSWSRGEAYLDPLYLSSGATLTASGIWTDTHLDLEYASLSIPGVRAVEASGLFDFEQKRVLRGKLAVTKAELEQIGPRYILPILAPAQAAETSFSGAVSAAIVFENGLFSGLDLSFDGAGFSQAANDLHFGPVDGTVVWRADATTVATLKIAAGRWQKLKLGAFGIDARLSGDSIDIGKIVVPVLDGKLVLTDLALRRDHEVWSGSGAAVVEPISMGLLTEAVGLPSMSGVLSASMPGVKVSLREVLLEGALVISVFDGYLQATGLRVVEPLGVASRLYADVEVRRIDLAQLTETFSFGSVSGFVDADLLELELVRWRPVHFDAHVLSSPGSYRRRISQRAVQNIGALGGPGATLALQRGFLQFFESFGYRELGLSCKLVRGVCTMGGLPGGSNTGSTNGFVIIQGGGIPALNVIGYNRRVDWDELLTRLQRVIESNTAPVIQ